MNRNIDDIYASIGRIITSSIQEPWSEAILEVELHTLALKLSGGYVQVSSMEPFPFSFEKEYKKVLIKDLVELHLKTDLDEKSRWNKMNYTLSCEGSYKVDFIWDQVLADDIEKVYEAS